MMPFCAPIGGAGWRLPLPAHTATYFQSDNHKGTVWSWQQSFFGLRGTITVSPPNHHHEMHMGATQHFTAYAPQP